MTTARLSVPAQYLFRVDDLCPTVHAERWERLRLMIEQAGIRPILAVVPANQDRELDASPEAPQFWQQMRELEAAGAAIALHGFNHVCTATGRSLVPLHRSSEFAGLDIEEQQQRIRRGLKILRGYGLAPKLFIAPRHGFDRNTLLVLRKEGIPFVSDGFARVPFVRGGVKWIPMQLWSPVRQIRGLWTICIHPNTTDDGRFEELRAFLRSNAAQFTSVDRVTAEYDCKPLNMLERAYEIGAMGRLRFRRRLSCLQRRGGR
jgi:hypothetical protein